MTNIMQTASQLALIATLSASPMAVLAQTADTNDAATEETVAQDSTTTVTPDTEENLAAEGETNLADDAASTSTDAEPVANADASDDEAAQGTDMTADADAPSDPSATTETTADSGTSTTVTTTGETTADSTATTGDATADTDTASDTGSDTSAEQDTDVATDSADPAAEPVDQTTAQSDTTTPAPDAEATTEMAAEAPKAVPGQIVMQSENTVLARDLLGSSVYSENGESIGDINNLIVSLDGKIDGVVIGVGGFLGLGEKDVAIEMASLKVSTDESDRTRLMTSSSKADLEAAEAFVTADAQQAASDSLRAMPTTDGAVGNTDTTQPVATD